MPLIYNKTTIPETSTALTYNGSPVYTVKYNETVVWELLPTAFGWPNKGWSFHYGYPDRAPGASVNIPTFPALPYDVMLTFHCQPAYWTGVDADEEDAGCSVSCLGQTSRSPDQRITVKVPAGTRVGFSIWMDRKRYSVLVCVDNYWKV